MFGCLGFDKGGSDIGKRPNKRTRWSRRSEKSHGGFWLGLRAWRTRGNGGRRRRLLRRAARGGRLAARVVKASE